MYVLTTSPSDLMGGNREKDSLSGARMPSSNADGKTDAVNLRHKIEHHD
jgi:hypothetical protein